MKPIDETGNTYGRLTVVAPCRERVSNRAVWECLCECGTTVKVVGVLLRRGSTQSCGCLQRELASIRGRSAVSPTLKHGLSGSRTHRIWVGMQQRCTNPRNKSYKNYGGRGVSVAPEWSEYSAFLSDMGECPANMSIERLDNELGYNKENCVWANAETQSNNRRNIHIIEHEGKRMSLSQWARHYGVKFTQLQYLTRKVSMPEAIARLTLVRG